MPVRFTGPDGPEELIPAPLVNISRAFVRGNDGLLKYTKYTFTLSGTIVNVDSSKDSPDAQGHTGMEGILAEQSRIRNLFKTEGGRLEIESPGGGGPHTIDAYCLVESIGFPEGVWVNRCPYTIVLSSTAIEGDDDEIDEIASSSENWNITENEDGTYTINHQLQAQGLLIYTSGGPNDPLEAAREWVYDRMYIIAADGTYEVRVPPADFDITSLITEVADSAANFWNKGIIESVDAESYSWSVTENWIFNPFGNYREEWSASINTDLENLQRTSITISGSVYGFANKSSDKDTRLERAKDAFFDTVEPNLSTRVAGYVPAGYTVSPVPTTKQYSVEPPGLIRYSYTFIAKKTGLITDSIEETISVSDVGKTDIFAQIQVPGRSAGPVVQNMRTVSLPERTVSISATLMPRASGIAIGSLLTEYLAKPNTNTLVSALRPSTGHYYVKQDTEEWNPLRRQYSRTVSWTINAETGVVDGIPSAPRNTP